MLVGISLCDESERLSRTLIDTKPRGTLGQLEGEGIAIALEADLA